MSSGRITRVGAIAAETLTGQREGQVMGVTSKGVFLHIDGQILFLTTVPFRSPFNMQFEGGSRLLEGVQTGEAVNVAGGSVSLGGGRLVFSVDTPEIWTPPAPVRMQNRFGRQYGLSRQLATQLSRREPGKGYLFLADPDLNKALDEQALRVRTAVTALTRAYLVRDRGGFLSASAVLIGSGGGLTPSGDDFLAGFFLYQNRLDQSLGLGRRFLQDWLEGVTRIASQRTTTISTNRLMAAGRGWLEEFFLQLIDHLFDTRVELPDDMTDLLLAFGHSSGVDTFMGIMYSARACLLESLSGADNLY